MRNGVGEEGSGGAEEGGAAQCSIIICVLAQLLRHLINDELEMEGGCSSNFIHSFRSWRQGLARLINFAARFLTMATFELRAISLGWARARDGRRSWGRLAGAELHFSPHLKILSFNN